MSDNAKKTNFDFEYFHFAAESRIVTKIDNYQSERPKKNLKTNSRIILLLFTLLLVSGFIIPCVRAADPLVVDFKATPQFGVRPLGVQFNDTSTSSNPANNTYLWRFGDGTWENLKNPLHTYTTSGTFTVNLTVTERTGNNATLSKPFYIHVGDAANTTDFSGTPQCGLNPLPVQFIDGTTLVHNQWQWDFGDGGASNVSDPLYTYNEEGAWNVSLYISNTTGGPQSIISKTDYIRVIPSGVASFSASDAGGSNPLTVQFTDTSTGFIAPITYRWDFGDGGKSAYQNPLHTYPDFSGVYHVTFTLTDNCGQTIIKKGVITVSAGSVVFQTFSVPGAPVADFTGIPFSGTVPLDVTFSDTSLNNPTFWNWSFGDGSYSEIRNPVHSYTSNGNYSVSLTAANAMGSSTKTRIEYITIPGFLLAPPIEKNVEFTGTPTYGIAPFTVKFTDASTGFNNSGMYLWDFGDGSTSTVRNASHIYTTQGSHTVSLTVTGSDGYAMSEIKPGYIITDIPIIEIDIGVEALEPLIETVITTSTTSQAQSLSLTKSGLQSQTFPISQSLRSGLAEDKDQSLPRDISPQNALSASRDSFNVKPSIANLTLDRGTNTNPHVFWMMIHSNVYWNVNVWDTNIRDGRMVEYDYSSSTYGSNYLKNALQLQSESRNGDLYPLSGPLTLSNTHRIIQQGPPMTDPNNPFKYFINLIQRVENSDTVLGSGKVYRVVITFEASPQIPQPI